MDNSTIALDPLPDELPRLVDDTNISTAPDTSSPEDDSQNTPMQSDIQDILNDADMFYFSNSSDTNAIDIKQSADDAWQWSWQPYDEETKIYSQTYHFTESESIHFDGYLLDHYYNLRGVDMPKDFVDVLHAAYNEVLAFRVTGGLDT